MKTSPFVRRLLTVGLGSLLGCGVTMADLKERNPAAAALEVHCRPWQIPENVKLFAVRLSSSHIVTDETQGELRDYAQDANVFIEINESAPPENAATMASEYGLICRQDLAIRSTPLESLRNREPCSARANVVHDSKYVGDTNPEPCAKGTGDSPNAAAGAAPIALPRIAVCARPKGITVNEWHGGVPGVKGARTITDAAAYASQIAKAKVIFYFDASAPPESVWNFGSETKVRCPGKPPIPYEQWVAKNSGTGTGSGATNSGIEAPATTSNAPKTGQYPPSATSSPKGKGPPLTTWEDFLRQLSLAGSLATGDVSGQTDHAQGDRYGATTGQNVGAFSFPPLQAGYALLQILSATGTNAKSFVDDIIQNARRGQRTVIKEVNKDLLNAADELINKHGRYQMAHGLEEMGTIMPYELGAKFTEKLGGKFQAHKLFEKRAFERFQMEGLDKAPCVILTDAEHKLITEKLRIAWVGKEKSMTLPELRKIYQDAYQRHPHWLEAIDSYFQ